MGVGGGAWLGRDVGRRLVIVVSVVVDRSKLVVNGGLGGDSKWGCGVGRRKISIVLTKIKRKKNQKNYSQYLYLV